MHILHEIPYPYQLTYCLIYRSRFHPSNHSSAYYLDTT